MEPKLKRIIDLLNKFDQFRACGPGDDFELHSIVCVDYHHLVTQLRAMATPYLPKYSSDLLNSVEVELDNIYSVYMAISVVSALLGDIREIVNEIDGAYFGPSKKDRILNIIKEFDGFQICTPSADPDEQSAVCGGYFHMVTQLQIMALPYLPESIAETLSSIEVDLNNIYTVYEARAVISSILGEIEDAIKEQDESVFDPAKVKKRAKTDKETKKDRILTLITSLRDFDTVPDWDSRADYEDTSYPEQVVRESCRSLITQFKILAIPFLPDYIVNHLNSIDLGSNLNVDEAMTVVNTLLPDIEQVIRGLNESEFDLAKEYLKRVKSETAKQPVEKVVPTPENLPKELWNIRQSISILVNNPNCYPDLDGYSGEVLEKIASTKGLAKELLSKHNDPLIKETLIELSKLDKSVEHIHGSLSFISSPSGPSNPYSPEEEAEYFKKYDEEVAETEKTLEKELPELKEKYYDRLEDLAARLEVLVLKKEVSQKEPTEQEHRDFLEKIKDEVIDLVRKPENKAHFRKRAEAFDSKIKEYHAELKQIKKDYEANPKLKAEVKEVVDRVFDKESEFNSDIFCALEGIGYLGNYKNYIYYDNGDFWGPVTQTPDLEYFMTEYLDTLFCNDKHKKLPNDEEKLLCYYIMLVDLHDKSVPENIIFFDAISYMGGGWSKIVCKQIRRCNNKTHDWITRALDAVKYDISVNTVQTGKSKEDFKADLTEKPVKTSPRKPEPDKPNEPNDLITLAVVIQDYQISRAQIKRDLTDGKLKSYRKKKRGKHVVRRTDVSNIYLKK